jgi:hyaluronan synthase
MIQLLDLILYYKLHLFLLFFIYVWIFFLIKLHFARKYKPYREAYAASVSIVIPEYKEPQAVLTRVLESIRSNSESIEEVIIAVDSRDGSNLQFLRNYEKNFSKLHAIEIKQKGKRAAEAVGIKKAKGEIVVIMDSDTVLSNSDTIAELIKPFKDPLVGGVTTAQRINMNPHNDLRKRFSDWMENMRCLLSFPAMSVKGVVGCLPGRCIAFRKENILPHIDTEFLNERFQGIHCETGDDRCLTNIVLRHGFKTVYQSTAKVLTDVPKSWKLYIKQQLRWIRSTRRETVANLKWMIRRPFILPLIFLSDILIPIFFAITILNMFLNMAFSYDLILVVQGTALQTMLAALLVGMLGAVISIGLRQTPHLRTNWKEVTILPLYVLWGTFVLTPLCIYGLFTMKSQKWMTR